MGKDSSEAFQKVKNEDKLQLYTVEEVAEHDKEDDLWVIIQGYVYDVTHWQHRHPGSNVVLLGIGGRDGSTPFVSYHLNNATRVKALMNAYRIGKVVKYKPSAMYLGFEELRTQLTKDGMFETDHTFYYKLYAWYMFVLAVVVNLTLSKSTSTVLLGGIGLGFFWQQVAFLGHDCGHNAVYHSREDDWFLGLFVTFFFGISGQWWKRSHNAHHIFPNSLDWDPDIQHLPFLAIDQKILAGIYSYYHKKEMPFDFIAQLFIRVQHILFFPIMGLARFFMYIQSYILILNPKITVFYRTWEILASIGYLVWVGALVSCIETVKLRIIYLLCAHAFCGILHIQITVSHFASPCYEGTGYGINEFDNFIKNQLYTTTDYNCSTWMDWFHGGLQFQVAHHLFPLVPRHNLRKLRSEYLLPFCKKFDLNYRMSDGFVPTVWFVTQKLYEQAMRVAAGEHIAMKDALLAELVTESING